MERANSCPSSRPGSPASRVACWFTLFWTVRGAFLSGTAFYGRAFEDYDGDGVREVTFGANASNNGADLNGFDDRHSYVGVIRLAPEPEVVWSRVLSGRCTRAQTFETDLDRGGQPELLSVVANQDSEQGRLQLRDPRTGELLREAALSFRWAVPIGAESENAPVVIALRGDGTLTAYDAMFRPVRSRRMPFETSGNLTGSIGGGR